MKPFRPFWGDGQVTPVNKPHDRATAPFGFHFCDGCQHIRWQEGTGWDWEPLNEGI